MSTAELTTDLTAYENVKSGMKMYHKHSDIFYMKHYLYVKNYKYCEC